MRRLFAASLVVLLGACTSGGGSGGSTKDPEQVEPRAEVAGWQKVSCKAPYRHIELIERGYYPGRSPDVTMTPKEPNLFATETGTTHSGPWPYVQDIPIVFYGPGFFEDTGRVELDREVTISDVAPTLAELLGMSFPDDRAGRSITEALVPDRGKPKLVLVIVWDGGGWNVLDRWPDAWPFLRSKMEEGTTITNAVVGSSPSVTPAVHASLGTGAFPKEHGVVDIWLRRGDVTRDSFENQNPRNLILPTFADLYDREMGNEPKVALVGAEGWHLGMMGHGSGIKGGDKDIAVLENDLAEPVTNPRFYSMPTYLAGLPGLEEDIRAVDSADGEVDNLWLGHRVLEQPHDRRRGPVRSLEQTRQIKAMIEREGFGDDDVTDLLFTNYKQVDLVGHSFNMVNPEMESVLQWTDETLKDLVGFLNDEVGEREWAMVLTSDHGQAPDPESTGAFPVDVLKIKSHVAEQVGRGEHNLFDKWRPTGYWLEPHLDDRKELAEEISDHIAGYRPVDSGVIPEFYEGGERDRIFESAFPMSRTNEVLECTSGR